MAEFKKEDLDTLKSLCRIALTDLEEQEVLHNLKRVVGYVDLLNELDLEKVRPTTHVLNGLLKNVMRDDQVGHMISKKEFLTNAPDQLGGMIRIPAIFQSEE